MARVSEMYVLTVEVDLNGHNHLIEEVQSGKYCVL